MCDNFSGSASSFIIGQPYCPVVGREPHHAISKLSSPMLSPAISCPSSIYPCRLTTAWPVSLVVFSLSYGVQVVTREVHRSSLRRTISFFSHCWLYLWLFSWLRCWSSYPCMWCWAYFFPFSSVRPKVSSVFLCWLAYSDQSEKSTIQVIRSRAGNPAFWSFFPAFVREHPTFFTEQDDFACTRASLYLNLRLYLGQCWLVSCIIDDAAI